LRIGVTEDDGGVVVHMGISGGLIGLDNSSDGGGWLAVHEDSDEVGSIAAEVKEHSRSVSDGIGEPWEPLGAHANLFGTFVSIVYNDLSDFAEFAGLSFGDSLGIGGVPGCLVVDEDLNVMLPSCAPDRQGIIDGGGQGFLNHGADVVSGGDLDDAAVVLDSGVDEHPVGMLGGEHMLEIRVEEGLRQMILGGVLLGKSSVGLDNGYKLGIGVLRECGEEAFYVSVYETDYGYPDGFALCMSVDRGGCESGEKKKWGKFILVLRWR
jgi:hypothetical protein